MQTIEGTYKQIHESFHAHKASDAEFQTIKDNQEKIRAKAGKGKLSKLKEHLILFLEMVISWLKGEYRDIPLASISVIVFTLIYVLSPLDFIPDIIPLTGLSDDAALVYLCLAGLSRDINRYRKFRNRKAQVPK